VLERIATRNRNKVEKVCLDRLQELFDQASLHEQTIKVEIWDAESHAKAKDEVS